MNYDILDNRIIQKQIDVAPNSVYEFSYKTDCVTGKFLRCTAADNLTVEGKFGGDVSYFNLETVGLDTSAFNGLVKLVDIRITAANVPYDIEEVFLEVVA